MKQNKKGFTLIELLAVIIILAIIALIAVPVVMNILTKARISAAADTAYSVLNAAELYYAEQLLDNPDFAGATFDFSLQEGTTGTNGELSGYELDLKGTRPTAGQISVSSNGVTTIESTLTINSYPCNAMSDGKISCGE